MSEPIIELVGVNYGADTTVILDAISWSIRPGEHWAVVGPNGCGKTTMLRIAAGFLWPNRGGEVRRVGQVRLDLRELRRSIGWVSSAMIPDIPFHECVLDTVMSGRWAQLGLKRFHGIEPTEVDRQAARQQLDILGSAQLAKKRFGVLSQGEKQTVLVARARMAEPLLIVLDEPCAGMDPGVRERFLETVQQTLDVKDSPSLILVTHHIEEIVPGITHLLTMSRGRILRSGPIDQIMTPDNLSELYGVKVHDIVRSGRRYWPVFA